ncbi:hypothetical protein L218DRAFT_981801 [Marasmius fiardii PR-910]|nr:hypothetical protein L218DRAFT_981801 [Marasmius fiardii PR-910]
MLAFSRFEENSLHPPHRCFILFISSRLDGVENIEDYKPGGYHPISIGDTLDMGRFRVLHKLEWGQIVTLKTLRLLFQSPERDSRVGQELRAVLTSSSDFVNFQTVYHHFSVQDPNGSHLFLVSALACPSVLAMSGSPGRVSGSRRLQADLARKVAKETATTIYHMHRAGIVQGDLTTSNILFRLSPRVTEWSDDEVYAHLAMLVESIQNSKISDASLLQESTVVSDFGQAHLLASPTPSYEPATVLNYLPLEARFERRFALFESFLGSDAYVLKQTVETLGRLPDPWWGIFKERTLWFEEDGQPKSERDQERANVLLKAYRSSIGDKLHEIGKQYDPPSEYEGPMVEEFGVLLPEEEIELLEDLLEKMLRYRPEERIAIQDVVRLHSWFAF